MADEISPQKPPPPPPPPPPKVNDTAASQAVGQQLAQQPSQKPPLDPANVQATASVQQAAGQRFRQFAARAPSSTDPAMPAAPSPSAATGPSSGAAVTAAPNTAAARQAALEKKFNATADKLAADSPTAKALLARFRAEGGKLTDGGDSGFFKDGHPPQIAIMTRSHGTATSEADHKETIAHELGHFDYARSGAPGLVKPGLGDNPGKSDRTIEAWRERNYVAANTNRNLGDEAHATEINKKIRDEVLSKTGNDIGVAGVDTAKPFPSHDALVERYAHLRPSGQPAGTNYRDYYGGAYRKFYDKNYAPGGPGNLW